MFVLKQTCGGCPEQYDVYLNNEEVGYMRLRHGYFYAEYRGREVYEAHPKSDGIFHEDERDHYLTQACLAIQAAMLGGNNPLYTIERDCGG